MLEVRQDDHGSVECQVSAHVAMFATLNTDHILGSRVLMANTDSMSSF